MSCEMPVWINYVFLARSPSREAATNGAAKSIKQNVVSNLRTAVERERNRECEWDRGKVAKCSRACKTLSHKICNLQSRSQLDRGCCRQSACWARYCPLTVGILHGQRARERGGERERESAAARAKDNFLMCFLPCATLITETDRETRAHCGMCLI